MSGAADHKSAARKLAFNEHARLGQRPQVLPKGNNLL